MGSAASAARELACHIRVDADRDLDEHVGERAARRIVRSALGERVDAVSRRRLGGIAWQVRQLGSATSPSAGGATTTTTELACEKRRSADRLRKQSTGWPELSRTRTASSCASQ